jgi:predicted DNA-binding protein (UPF0251 family)
MTIQFIHDNKGNTTEVFIPIEEWQALKLKYTELQKEEANTITNISNWQKNIIDERLNDYYQNATDVLDFDETINDIEKNL